MVVVVGAVVVVRRRRGGGGRRRRGGGGAGGHGQTHLSPLVHLGPRARALSEHDPRGVGGVRLVRHGPGQSPRAQVVLRLVQRQVDHGGHHHFGGDGRVADHDGHRGVHGDYHLLLGCLVHHFAPRLVRGDHLYVRHQLHLRQHCDGKVLVQPDEARHRHLGAARARTDPYGQSGPHLHFLVGGRVLAQDRHPPACPGRPPAAGPG